MMEFCFSLKVLALTKLALIPISCEQDRVSLEVFLVIQSSDNVKYLDTGTHFNISCLTHLSNIKQVQLICFLNTVYV